MKQLIQTKGISFGSIYKILFFGLLFSVGPLLVVAGIFSYFGSHVVTFNGEYVIGINGLMTGIGMAFIFPVIFATLFSIFIGFGLWIYTRFKGLNINVKKEDVS